MSDNEMSFDDLSAFVPGAVGPAGQRVFYLQARRNASAMSIRCEKQHVAALAEYFGHELDGPSSPLTNPDLVEFSEPDRHEMVAGSLGVGHDEANERFVVVLHAIEGEEDADGERVRFSIDAAMARAFVSVAEGLLTSGRPPCPFCEAPMDPAGHACPRMN